MTNLREFFYSYPEIPEQQLRVGLMVYFEVSERTIYNWLKNCPKIVWRGIEGAELKSRMNGKKLVDIFFEQ